MIEPLRALLPIELTNGNDGRGHKWFRTAKVRQDIEIQIRQLGLVRDPFEFPVKLEITRILGKGQRLWDMDSILRGNSKELIDALCNCGWFWDDSPRWITKVTAHQDATRRDIGPAIELVVDEC